MAALAAIFFGLRQALRRVVRAGLRVADGLGQHLAQLSLRLCRLPRVARFLPVSHKRYVGMPEGEVNPSGDCKNQGQQPSAIDGGLLADNPLWSP